jgi:hypothetical protein
MSKKNKPQKVTFKSIFRLSLFLILVFILISWFSSQNSIPSNNDPTVYIGESLGGDVLGAIYSKLPESSRFQLENFNQTEVGKFIFNSSEAIKKSLDGFPQKQIKEIKKGIIKNISDDMIKNIEDN